MRPLLLAAAFLASAAFGEQASLEPAESPAHDDARYSKRHAVPYAGMEGFIERPGWDGLGLQEQLMFRQICLASEARRAAGIEETAWSALPMPVRGARALGAVKKLAGAEFAREIERMIPAANAVGALPSRASREMKEEFIRTVLFWQDQYRVAELDAKQAKLRKLMTEFAVKASDELAYRDAHDSMGRALERTAELRAKAAQAATANEPGALGKAFDGATAGAKSAPVPSAGGTEKGPATSAPAPLRQGPDGVHVPSDLLWTYQPQPPKGPEGLLWAGSGREEREAELVKEVMGGLKTPVEREVLRSVAEAQVRFRAQRQWALEEWRRSVEAVKVDLAKPGLSDASRERLAEELQRRNEEREKLDSLSEEIAVTAADIGERSIGAHCYWGPPEGPGGRRKLTLKFNRRILEAPEKDNPKDALRKIAVHELTHVADNLNGWSEPRPELFVEPRAYLNGALSFQEEGKPKGPLPEMFGARDHAQISGDPLGWMHRALERGKWPEAGPWYLISTDDLQDPESALEWRLSWAYRKATLAEGGPPPAETLRKRAIRYGLDEAAAAILVQVREDPRLLEIQKPLEFARLARRTDGSRAFVARLKGYPANEREALDRQQKEFFDRLARLEP